MVDLNPSNAKLRDRAVRIVQALTGVDAAEVRRALDASGWVVQAAIDQLGGSPSRSAHNKPLRAMVDGRSIRNGRERRDARAKGAREAIPRSGDCEKTGQSSDHGPED
jgi:hypothetical protein